MQIIFACGGTLGHIMPAVSIAHIIKEKDKNTNIIFIMTTKDEKYEFLKNDSCIDRIYYFDIDGLNRKKLVSNIKNIFKILKAIKKIKQIINPSIMVFGMGGYISAIVIKIANRLGKKTIIHEQNKILGLANKLVYKDVSLVLSSFPLKGVKSTVIGNPRMVDAKKYLGNKQDNHILITSGSLGSKFVNDLAIKWLKTSYSKKYYTTIITGKGYYEEVKKELGKGLHFEVLSIVDNLLEYMSKASLVVSRAGATTIFEIIGLEVPSIIIPSPNVTNNHQYFNALYLYEQDASCMLKEEDINIEIFNKYIENTINNSVLIDNLKKIRLEFEEIDLIKVIESVSK